MLGHIFNFVAMTIIEAIRATGNSKVPLYILVTIEIANIILNPILINIGLGIKGAAIATAISMILGLILSLIYIYTKNKSLSKISMDNVKIIGKNFLEYNNSIEEISFLNGKQ